MAAGARDETDRIIAAIERLDYRVSRLAGLVGEQARMLDRLLALIVPDAPDEGPSLPEMVERLVTVTVDNDVLLRCIYRQLEQQGLGTGRRTE